MNQKFFKYFLLFFVITSSNFVATNEPTPAQLDLLKQLPPDLRDNVKDKMTTASALQSEVEEIFEDGRSLILKPELEDIEGQEFYCADCIYGYNFFKFSPSSFAPVGDTPVSASYVLGPGDKILVNFYGSEELEEKTFINREGLVVLPFLGPVYLQGMSFSEASEFLKKKAKNDLLGVDVNLSIRDVRSIGIYILGEAYKPGKYVMSGLSSITNALYISGGVSEKGSLRNIQIRRNNQTIATYDFYDFLLKGSVSTNINLEDGDVIFVPFIEESIFLGGAFKRPYRYEIKNGETIKDAIQLAGGFSSDVMEDTRLELSFVDRKASQRKMIFLDMNLNLDRALNDGDVINISSTAGLAPQSIKVSGEVNRPGEYSIQQGDTILDILNRAGGMTKEAYHQGAVFLREDVAQSQKEAFNRSADQLENTIIDVITGDKITQITEFTLSPIGALIEKLRTSNPPGRMIVDLDTLKLKTDPIKNFTLKDGDSLFIPKRPNYVSIVGEVLNTATVGFDPDLSVDEYIELSGGLNTSADRDKIFVILPNGKSQLVRRSLFSSRNYILPGSTVVISRDARPFDALSLTRIVTPILADLATSAAAIAAISNN
jgi:protein involved in polysaccharide export with SLBB domain